MRPWQWKRSMRWSCVEKELKWAQSEWYHKSWNRCLQFLLVQFHQTPGLYLRPGFYCISTLQWTDGSMSINGQCANVEKLCAYAKHLVWFKMFILVFGWMVIIALQENYDLAILLKTRLLLEARLLFQDLWYVGLVCRTAVSLMIRKVDSDEMVWTYWLDQTCT